jgi:hypothetical protein
MADVFLSYSRQDKALAAHFVELLEGRGWDVFWDQETRAGTLWPKVLEDELNKARCLLVLWTANSVASRWVRIEAYEALQNDKLLPVRLDNVKPPLEFRQTQIFDLVGWTGEPSDPRLARLFEDLEAIAKCAPPKHVRTGKAAGDPEAARPRPPATPAPKAAPTSSSPAPMTATAAAEPEVPTASAFSPPEPAPEPAVVARSAPPPAEHRAPAKTADQVPATAEPAAAASDDEPAARAAPEEPRWLRSRPAWIAGIAAAAVASVGLLRVVMTSEEAPPNATPAMEKAAPAPPKSQVIPPASETSAAAATVDAPPARVPTPAEPPGAPAAGKIVAQSPPATRAAPGAARATPPRCLEITEKFQTTGQLTEEERRFLSSKECAK